MQKIHISITINAPVERVWSIMLNDDTYRQWTSAFHAGSYYRGDWNQGSKILFIGPDENGGESGMVSRIAENRLHEYISIEHLGIYADGVEDTTSEEAKKWVPAFENYTFESVENGTKLIIDQDIDPEYKEMFEKMWADALEKLKELAEKN
jgi:hypothetical protein